MPGAQVGRTTPIDKAAPSRRLRDAPEIVDSVEEVAGDGVAGLDIDGQQRLRPFAQQLDLSAGEAAPEVERRPLAMVVFLN